MEAETKPPEIEQELKRRIKKTVKKILQGSSLYEMTEKRAREEASAQLCVDLSEDRYKFIVREVVESFLEEFINKTNIQKTQYQKGGQQEEGEKKKKKSKKKSSSK